MASPSDRQGGHASEGVGSARDVLTGDRLEALLARLGADRGAAAAEYERIRGKLIDLFDWWGSDAPQDDADRTIDRVARKLEEGEAVVNVKAYFHGVARNVLLESGRRRAREGVAGRELARATSADALEAERRVACLERCLRELPPESRDLIVRYYQGPGNAHLEGRKRLAEQLGISYGSLKTRAHRLRGRLEECLRDCLADETNGNAQSQKLRGRP